MSYIQVWGYQPGTKHIYLTKWYSYYTILLDKYTFLSYYIPLCKVLGTMADRTCARCGKVFDIPCHLRRHQKRKTPCAPIVEATDLPEGDQQKPFGCKFCGRKFSTEPSMWKHVRTACKIAGSEEGMEKLYEHTLQKQLEEQQKQIAEMAEMMKRMEARHMSQLVPHSSSDVSAAAAAAVTVSQINQTAQTITNIGSIQFNIFGKEDTKHIGQTEVKALLDDVLSSTQDPTQGAIAAFLKAAMLVYSDPGHPENLTCYLPNSKKDDVLVHVGEGWTVQPYKVVLPPMATKSLDTLFEKQPFVDADKYGDLMKALVANEQAYKEGKEMRTVLVRNKALLEKALGALPK